VKITNIRFITFYIKDFLFGLDIFSVREINKQLDFTKVPLSEPEILGLVNLRGQIVTTVDTSVLLNLEKSDIKELSRNIILKSESIKDGNNDTDIYGLLVDEIGDVIETTSDRIENVPSNLNDSSSNLNVKFIKNILKLEDDIMMILDLNEFFKKYNEK